MCIRDRLESFEKIPGDLFSPVIGFSTTELVFEHADMKIKKYTIRIYLIIIKALKIFMLIFYQHLTIHQIINKKKTQKKAAETALNIIIKAVRMQP